MLNMIDTQDKLKNFSEGQLVQEMQRPSGSAPQFMVLGEIERRKRIRSDAQRQEGLMQPTVAQDVVSAAGVPQQGIAQVAQSLAPKTDMTQNTGVQNVQAGGLPAQPNQPQRMADGGIMRLAPGGKMPKRMTEDMYNLSVNYPQIYRQFKDDPEMLAQFAQALGTQYEKKLRSTRITTPEKTGLEELELKRSSNLLKRIFTDPTNREIGKQEVKDAEDFGEDYAFDQRRQSIAALRRAEEDPNSTVFADGAPVEPVPSISLDAYMDGTKLAGPTSRYQSRFPSAMPQTTSAQKVQELQALMAGRGLSSQDQDGLASLESVRFNPPEEKARQAYLAGDDYSESDVPAIVDMLNRGREFQQRDTYTPPKQIYTDLGANSPLGGLKYTMDGASEDEQAEMFAQYSDRLGVERGIAQDIKEQEAFARAENAKRIAGDAMDEDVAMERGLEGPRFRNKIGKQEVQVQGGLGLGQKGGLGLGQTLNPNTIIARGTEYLKGVDERTKKTNDQSIDNIGRFNAAESQGNAMGAAAEVFTPPNPYEIKMQKKKDGAELAKRLADEASMVDNSGLAAIKKSAEKSVKKTSPSTDDGKQTFKSTAQNMNEDKWLALAQAGLTLMSTGDFGKAGSAGLAALRESKKTDLAERKIRSDEAFNEARIGAAKKGKPIPGALITGLSKELLQLQDAYSLIADTAYDRYFGLGDRVDPDRAERTRLENKIKEIRRRLEFAYRSHGMGSDADASPKNEQYNVASKE